MGCINHGEESTLLLKEGILKKQKGYSRKKKKEKKKVQTSKEQSKVAIEDFEDDSNQIKVLNPQSLEQFSQGKENKQIQSNLQENKLKKNNVNQGEQAYFQSKVESFSHNSQSNQDENRTKKLETSSKVLLKVLQSNNDLRTIQVIDQNFFESVVEEAAQVEEEQKIYINGLSQIREQENEGTLRGSIIYKKKIIPIELVASNMKSSSLSAYLESSLGKDLVFAPTTDFSGPIVDLNDSIRSEGTIRLTLNSSIRLSRVNINIGQRQ